MKQMWKRVATVAAAGIVAAGLLAGCGQDAPKESGTKYRVGLVQIVQHPALDEATRGIVDGLAKKGLVEGKDISIDRQNAQGDQSNLDTIVRRFLHDKEQLIFAVATPSAQAVANATAEIPVVGTAITDFVAAKLVQSNEKPGTNVTGTSDAVDIAAQLTALQELMPNLHTLGVVYNTSEINSELQVAALEEAAAARNIEVKRYAVSSVNDIPQAAGQLVQEAQAVFVPTDNVVASALPALVSAAHAASVPVFGSERAHVQNGAVAALSIDFYTLGVRAGEMGADILLGNAKPETTAVETQREYALVINRAEVEKLGLTLPAGWEARAEWVQ